MKKAILFLTFNRLDVVQKSFESIRKAKPPRFYVASDGPRENVDGEKEKVDEVRKWILDNIDWDCEIKTRFLNKNSGGCAKGVSSAITWFFENEQDGIILEDDCVANQSFFSFCEELLDKYKDNKAVWHISGDGFYNGIHDKESYYFAKIMHCWGWATWADRWQKFKPDLNDYDKKYLKKFSRNYEVQEYWGNILYLIQNNKIDTWAYTWTFWIVANNGYCINPYKNLVKNIGIEGVHYSGTNPLLNLETFNIGKIIHPKEIKFNKDAIDYIYKNVFRIRRKKFKLFRKEKMGNKRKITILGVLKFSYPKDKVTLAQKYAFNPRFIGIFVNPFYFSRKALFDNIKVLSKQIKGKNLLDVGCGTEPYKYFFDVDDYVGLEHESGRAEWKKATVYYDGKHFPFEDNSFENIVSFQVFEHVFEPELLLSEMNRVLKPGGMLLLSLPLVGDEHEQPYDFGRYTSFGMKYLLKKHGFKILKYKKTVADVSLIFQLINDYIYKILIGKNKPINHFFINIFCSVFNIMGIVLAKILPKNEDLYLDNVILATKRGNNEID